MSAVKGGELNLFRLRMTTDLVMNVRSMSLSASITISLLVNSTGRDEFLIVNLLHSVHTYVVPLHIIALVNC